MTFSKPNILLVDDKPDKLLALEVVLSDLDVNLVRASSGREALRYLLRDEFAVILLDVNMPSMDGFETAALIRQRRSSRDTPIIFITAFADEMHMARGYSVGAVDYILAPVIPEILRTKVRVLVDLYRQRQQLEVQAELQRRRAGQLQRLAAASLAINSSRSLHGLLKTVADSARDAIGAHQAITLFLPASAARTPKSEAVGSFSDKYAQWRDRPLRLDVCAETQVARSPVAVRLTQAQLERHPDWEIVRDLEVPPIHGMMAAPLVSAGSRSLGLIYVSDKEQGEFTEDDEAILTQLAQMASIAIENTLYAEERESNRLKDEFLATLSHELRTPLNAILGWTQMLRTGPAAAADIAHGLEVIERNVKAQSRLIEDLLDVSRITTGKLRLTVRKMELASVIRGAIDSARPAAEARRIALDGEIPDDTGSILGDPDRIQQVVWNLLSNAIKFTPAGGRVTASVQRKGGRIEIRVADTGKGIEPTFLPYVFDRFRQADSSTTRSHGGLGLGLAIVRHLVELHGGTVSADSEGHGRGSVFTVDLPERTVAEPGPLHAPRPQNGEHLPMPGSEVAIDLKGLRILAVDDEPDARELIRHVLSRTGANVEVAASAQEALESIDRQMPDILVSDIGMPEADGYSLIREVRKIDPDRGGNMPAIALTAYVREEDRAKMLAAGFTAHVPKPVEPAELIRVISHISGRTMEAAISGH
ncbi:MAG TPA: response regulator [Tepidisphaeraceae bacterium]|jgi:signal transduction histidine kinase